MTSVKQQASLLRSMRNLRTRHDRRSGHRQPGRPVLRLRMRVRAATKGQGLKMTDEELMKKLCDIESGLSDWEQNFVEDVSAQLLDRNIPLTARQRRVAERILTEKGHGR